MGDQGFKKIAAGAEPSRRRNEVRVTVRLWAEWIAYTGLNSAGTRPPVFEHRLTGCLPVEWGFRDRNRIVNTVA